MSIIEYKLVTSTYANDIEDTVAELIDKGWQPLGGITRDEGLYMQAMVKYADES